MKTYLYNHIHHEILARTLVPTEPETTKHIHNVDPISGGSPGKNKIASLKRVQIAPDL